MILENYSAWNYGHTITKQSKFLNFIENGVDELSAEMSIGAYTLEEFSKEIAAAMNRVSSVNDYTTLLDRDTRKVTIVSSGGNFDLLIDSGTQFELSVFELAGFSGLDVSGLDQHEGNSPSGSQFIPQFKLQGFMGFDDSRRTSNAAFTENTKGDIVEVINYGNIDKMKCNIVFQTNIIPQRAIREDEFGVDKLRDFLRYITTKAPVEFIENISIQSEFSKCIIAKTKEDSKGLGFDLKNMRSSGFPNYFTTGELEFRAIK